MNIIHLSWFGKGWNKKPIFWVEDKSSILDFNNFDIKQIFSFEVKDISLGKGKNSRIGEKVSIYKFEFSPHNILKFFHELNSQDNKNSFLLGKEIKFWEIFSKWCVSFLIRQEVIPYLIKTQKGLEARWLPVFKDVAYRDLLKFVKYLSMYEIISPKEDIIDAANNLIDICYVITDAFCRSCAIEAGFRQEMPDSGSIHDLWLHALLDREAEIKLYNYKESCSTIAPKDIDKFYSQIITWQKPIAEKSTLPFKLLFKLTEPQEDNQEWKLEVFLQAIDDPDFILPISFVWQNPKDSLLTSRGFINSKTTILAMLSRASKLFLPIKRQLIDPERPFINLDTKEAYLFLKEALWLLKEDGFSVLTPNWWRSNGSIHKLQVKASISSSKFKDSMISLNDFLDFKWQLTLNGMPLNKEELLHLSSLKEGLIKLRGRWIDVNNEDINKLAEFSVLNKKGKINISKIIAAFLGAQVCIDNIIINEIEVSGWLGEFLEELKTIKNKKALGITPSKKFCGKLRTYQVEGLSWLYFMTKWGLGVCLADDMGLGKTIQILALIDKYLTLGCNGPFLVISPTSVIGNWEKEISKFLPMVSFYVHQGTNRVSKEQLKKIIINKPIVVTSYAILTRDFERLKDINWFGVIVDEAQNIKNPFSKQFRYAKQLKARFKIALTGTPIENSLIDLWSIMDFLNPGLLGSFERFRRDFLIPIQLEDNREILKKLKSIISPFILRREKTDSSIGLKLPEKEERQINAFLTEEQTILYKDVVEDVKKRLDTAVGIAKKGLILSTITKLKQICDHPALFLKDNSKIKGRSGKLEILSRFLFDILNNKESVLIFTQFSSMGDILKQYLSELFNNIEVLFIYGGLPKTKRDKIVWHFQTSKQPQILILSLRASGTGLNLTKATHVFHYDRWWNPAVENQATDRAYRIGQMKDVKVYKFICKGTIEEKIEKILKNKIVLAKNIITTNESWITKLSDNEIKELITLDD